MFVFGKPLFPKANVAMGIRMTKDMVFDSAPAIRDFGRNPGVSSRCSTSVSRHLCRKRARAHENRD